MGRKRDRQLDRLAHRISVLELRMFELEHHTHHAHGMYGTSEPLTVAPREGCRDSPLLNWGAWAMEQSAQTGTDAAGPEHSDSS